MTSLSLANVHRVFLSFRGDQLRYSFVSHLMDAFERHRILFLTDKNEQRRKNVTNLFVRIKESKIHSLWRERNARRHGENPTIPASIIRFIDKQIRTRLSSIRISGDHKYDESLQMWYAESSWCMDELVKMKKRADQGKLQVIPIFYKVRARDVRGQTGEFGDKFWTLAKASRGDQIKKWMEALECISNKMGLSLGEKSSEADFIKEIVKEVKKVLATIGCEDTEDHHCVSSSQNKKRKMHQSSREYEMTNLEQSLMTLANARDQNEQNQEVPIFKRHGFIK